MSETPISALVPSGANPPSTSRPLDRYVTDSNAATPVLRRMARQIERWSEETDYRVVKAALKLRDLRKRVENGEAGEGVRWYAWALDNIHLSKSRICELQAIANSKNPNAAIEELRKNVRERVQKCRARAKAVESSREPDRRAMRKWLKVAAAEDVTIFWRQISRAMVARQNLSFRRAQN